MNWKILALTLLPGLCLIQQGRPGRGILWFFLFVLLLNAFLISPYLVSSPHVRFGALTAAVVVWILSAGDGIRYAAATKAAKKESTPVDETNAFNLRP